MKYITLFVLPLLILSCSKDKAPTVEQPREATLSMNMNGDSVIVKGLSFCSNSQVGNVNHVDFEIAPDKNANCRFQILNYSSLAAGTSYDIQSFQGYYNGKAFGEDSPASFTQMKISIIQIKDGYISGSFSGKCFRTAKDSLVIKNGSFSDVRYLID